MGQWEYNFMERTLDDTIEAITELERKLNLPNLFVKTLSCNSIPAPITSYVNTNIAVPVKEKKQYPIPHGLLTSFSIID